MPYQLYLYAAGSNGNGQLAIGSTDDAHTFTPCLFADHVPGLLPPKTERIMSYAGGALGSGSNSRGQLGPSLETHTNAFHPLHLPLEQLGLHSFAPIHIAAAWDTSYVVLRHPGRSHRDVVLSFGGNDFGDLGAGSPAPLAAVHVLDFSSVVGEQGFDALQIAAGPHHAAVLLRTADGHTHLAGWGAARHGQLGAPAPASAVPAPTYPRPRAIALPTGFSAGAVTALALGSQHTALLFASGRVLGLGANRKAQLAGLDSVRRARGIGCTWNGTYAVVDAPGGRSCWPRGAARAGSSGGIMPSAVPVLAAVEVPFVQGGGRRVGALVCGSEHVLVVVEPVKGAQDAKEVWGWGWNEHGNLGTGTLDDVFVATKLWPKIGADEGQVMGVWAGCGTSWIAVSRSCE